MRTADEARAWLLGLMGVAMFSLSLPMTRLAVIELPPIFVGPGRAVVAVCHNVVLAFIRIYIGKMHEMRIKEADFLIMD
jgi:hypothetical protein